MPNALQFDPSNQSLHSASGSLQLPPKAFAILDYLRQHPQQLVTKEELLSAVWPGLFVTDAVLKVTIGELRKLLVDDPKQPRYIETIHRRGYRFIGELPLLDSMPTPLPQIVASTPLSGRETALNHLQQTWANAQHRQRQITFVQAEAGFGKTTLLNHWHSQLPTTALHLSVQCLDQYGKSEPYQPFFDALAQLINSPQQAAIIALLRQYAPTWLVQIPALQHPEFTTLQAEVFGATQGRVLREFAEFVETLSQQTPVLLLIDDLHWCDAASVELLAVLAYRSTPARLMVVGSYRPSNVVQHLPRLQAIVSELTLNRKCHTLSLETLDRQALQTYLFTHLPSTLHQDWLVTLFAQYTEGHPLFLHAALEHLKPHLDDPAKIQPSWLETCISGGLKQLLALKTTALGKQEFDLLQAASIAPDHTSAESIAAILEHDVLSIEDTCTHLLQQAFWLVPHAEQHWPDGTICDSYRFHHQLYREFLYNSLAAARRRHYHLRLAKRLQLAYQSQLTPIASQLAYHFEAGGDTQQAIHFWQQASHLASQRFAYNEAIQHLEHAITLLSKQTVDSATRLTLSAHHCTLLLASGRLGDAIHAYQQLIADSQQANATATHVHALLGLAGALFWIDRRQCLQTGQQAVRISQTCTDPTLAIHARGKQAHWEAIIDGYRPEHAEAYEQALQMAQHSPDPHLKCTHHLLYIYYLTIRADYTRASAMALTTQALAKAAGDANNYLASVFFHAWALFYRGEWGAMLDTIHQAVQLADKNDYPFWKVHFYLQQAWLYAQMGDYATAATICQPIYAQTCQLPGKNSAYFFSLTILLQASNGLRQWQTAQQQVEEIDTSLAQDPHAIDWVLRLPLQQALTEYWLQRQAWQAAQTSAEHLYTLAQQSGEHTYLTLADSFFLRIQQGSPHPVTVTIPFTEQARPETPVATWQLLALQHQYPAAATHLRGLLASLHAYPQQQTTLAQHPSVSRILTLAPSETVSVTG